MVVIGFLSFFLLSLSVFSANLSISLNQKKIRAMMRYFPVVKNLEDNQKFLGETKKSLERLTVEILSTVQKVVDEPSSSDEVPILRRGQLERRRSVHIKKESPASELLEHIGRAIHSGSVLKMGEHGRW